MVGFSRPSNVPSLFVSYGAVFQNTVLTEWKCFELKEGNIVSCEAQGEREREIESGVSNFEKWQFCL